MKYQFIAIAVTLLAAAGANGQMTVVSGSRMIKAEAGISGEITASKFGPSSGFWSDSVSVEAVIDEATTNTGTASQTSTIDPHFLAISGSAGGSDAFIGGGGGIGGGSVKFNVTFTVTEPVPYDLSSTGGFSGGLASSYSVRLFSGSELVIDWRTSSAGSTFPNPAFATGTFLPGVSYTFVIDSWAGGAGFGTSSDFISFESRLDVPAPATALVYVCCAISALRRRRHC